MTDRNRFGTFSYVPRELKRYKLGYIHFNESRVDGAVDSQRIAAELASRHFRPLSSGDTKLVSAGDYTFASGTEAVRFSSRTSNLPSRASRSAGEMLPGSSCLCQAERR